MPAHRPTSAAIETEAQLVAPLGEPAPLRRQQVADGSNALTRQFIERAPPVCLGSAMCRGNFEAEKYDPERAARYARREGFY